VIAELAEIEILPAVAALEWAQALLRPQGFQVDRRLRARARPGWRSRELPRSRVASMATPSPPAAKRSMGFVLPDEVGGVSWHRPAAGDPWLVSDSRAQSP
jgi:hypothetical protein